MVVLKPERATDTSQEGRGSNRLSLQGRRTRIAYTFLAIPILFYTAIRVYPTIQAFWLSFTIEGSSSLTLVNYSRLLADPIFWQSVYNTFLYTIITVPIEMVLGLLLAVGIERIRVFRGFYRIVFFLPYMTSIVAVSWVWRLIYSRDTGLLNEFLVWLGIPAQGWLNDPSQALVSISIVMIWQTMGFSMLIFSAGLNAIPKEFYEAATIDGAGAWKSFWRITIPLLNPTIVFLAIIGVIQTLQTFTQIANLTGGDAMGGPLHSTTSIVVYMYQQGFESYDMNYASASTVFLFVLILIVTLFQFRVLNRGYKL
ncbi:MAG: carbohydrate ABC transporter permease [Nakamurella sp.]